MKINSWKHPGCCSFFIFLGTNLTGSSHGRGADADATLVKVVLLVCFSFFFNLIYLIFQFLIFKFKVALSLNIMEPPFLTHILRDSDLRILIFLVQFVKLQVFFSFFLFF